MTNIKNFRPKNRDLSNDEYHPIFENSYDLFMEQQKSKFLNIIQCIVEYYNTYIAERGSEKISIRIFQN
jgi:hypothetical protein